MGIENKLYKDYLKKLELSEEEYARLCVPYLGYAHLLFRQHFEYAGKEPEFQTMLLQNSACTKNSCGGELIHRGYYCPSPVMDIIVDNASRGHLCKADNPNAVYTHYFDAEGRHIACCNKQTGSFEYIIWDGNTSLGIQFENGYNIAVSCCVYDEQNRIESYEYILCFQQKLLEYRRELYTYSSSAMVLDKCKLNCQHKSRNLLSLDRFDFSSEDGYLKTYTHNGRSYEITKKRKIF